MALILHTEVTEDQINEQIDEASDGIDSGSRWPGMSYEQGVKAALDWVLGNEELAPMADD